MDIKEAVGTILEGIPEGHVFDSHYVTNALIAKEEFTDAYLEFACNYTNGQRPTLRTHQQIGRVIGSNEIVERLNYESWSMNIHGRGSKCALWRRK